MKWKKDIETIKKDQSEIKNTISEINNTLEGINSRLDEAENWINYFEDQAEKNTQSEKQQEKRILENQDGGVGRHTAPPHTTRTDRKSNSKEVQHQVHKKETFIQTGRRGGENSSCHGRTETAGVWDDRDRQSDH